MSENPWGEDWIGLELWIQAGRGGCEEGTELVGNLGRAQGLSCASPALSPTGKMSLPRDPTPSVGKFMDTAGKFGILIHILGF